MLKLKSTEAKKYKKDDFKNSLVLSLVLHVAVILLFLIKFIFFSKPVIDLSQAISVNMEDFQDTDRLPKKNIVGANTKTSDSDKLPQKMQKTEPELPPKSQPEPPTEKKEIVEKNRPDKPSEKEVIKSVVDQNSINLSKSKQKEAISKLKKLSALEKIKQDLKNESLEKIKSSEAKAVASTKESKDSKLSKGEYKTRIIAAGSEISGLDKMQANNYLREVDQSIKQFWALPQWLITKSFKAQALVKFNTAGEILSVKIVSSSGNNSYDQYCLQAIEKAAPFPKVPEKLSEKFSIDGIIIGFPE